MKVIDGIWQFSVDWDVNEEFGTLQSISVSVAHQKSDYADTGTRVHHHRIIITILQGISRGIWLLLINGMSSIPTLGI